MVKKEYIVAVASRLKVLSPDLYYDDTSDTSDPPAVRVIHSVISQALTYPLKRFCCLTRTLDGDQEIIIFHQPSDASGANGVSLTHQ